ncbi:MAG: DUF3467 domain-containing protein [Anaerolineaceae bacterium]
MSDPPVRQPPPIPNMEMPADMEALYSNLVRISHSPAELVFDFARMLPGQTVARVVSRLLMSPVGAKLFYRALAENLARYEAAFGEIPLPGDSPLANDLFRSHHPPDS